MNCVHGSFHGMDAVLRLFLAKSRMKSAASAFLKTAISATRHAGRAVTKAAGEGGREGIKNATKELVKEHALKLGRGHYFQPMSSMGAEGLGAGGSTSHIYMPQMYGMMGVSVGAQKYPASCECDYYVAAPVSPSGKKILTCHSCAPKGMGGRNYQRALEAILPVGARARAAPARFRSGSNAGKKGSRGRSLNRGSRTRRAGPSGRAKSEGRTRPKSK